jgi:membrane protein DedA with SNARE-associated domain
LKNNEETSQFSQTWITLARILALIFVIAVSILIVMLPEEQVSQLEGYGYPGIFFLSILSNATVLVPAPGLLIVFSMGARVNPLWVGIAAGLGATIGELSGYLAGFSGQAIIENRQMYERMVGWMKKNGPLTIVGLAFIPNPIFDLTGIAAGALKMPVMQFLFWAMIGKIIKMLITAYAGAGLFSIPWLNDLLLS